MLPHPPACWWKMVTHVMSSAPDVLRTVVAVHAQTLTTDPTIGPAIGEGTLVSGRAGGAKVCAAFHLNWGWSGASAWGRRRVHELRGAVGDVSSLFSTKLAYLCPHIFVFVCVDSCDCDRPKMRHYRLHVHAHGPHVRIGNANVALVSRVPCRDIISTASCHNVPRHAPWSEV
jgi:hypothetical protein